MVIAGDALECLRLMPDECAHCCVTSPPYYGLRDYGVAGQIGLEPTPEAYVERMVEVFREVRRALRSDGTLWLNIGDSYNGSKTGNTEVHKNPRAATNSFQKKLAAMCKPKDLIGIPWMLAFALRADGWYLRRDIIWHKPNPMPESVTDRPTSAHEYLFLLTKSARYFYDADAIKEPTVTGGDLGILRGRAASADQRISAHASSIRKRQSAGVDSRTAGSGSRNKRSVWTITSAPFRGAHFTTFPPALVEPCILAGTSARGVCPKCGAPWGRVLKCDEGPKATERGRRLAVAQVARTGGAKTGGTNSSTFGIPATEMPTQRTIGWHPTCSCNAAAVPATVLDPFFGAGTTGIVAQQQGRDCIGIELNPDYALMAHRRIEAARPIKEAA